MESVGSQGRIYSSMAKTSSSNVYNEFVYSDSFSYEVLCGWYWFSVARIDMGGMRPTSLSVLQPGAFPGASSCPG